MPRPLPAHDLDHVLAHVGGDWEQLRGARLFITGGTGFFGAWLLESFAWANRARKLNASALVLSRDPRRFLAAMPHLANEPALRFLVGDAARFEAPGGTFTHWIVAAADSTGPVATGDSARMLKTILGGTERALELAARAGNARLLLISSGAVYGRQPPEIAAVNETYAGAPDATDPASAYGEGKRVAELLCAIAARRGDVSASIARCFAFIGPHLPLDAHFAAGNFLRDALAGGPIHVSGDGTPVRSYLHAADLAVWLWTILLRGAAGRAYNVGASRAVSIAELAACIAESAAAPMEVRIAKRPDPRAPAQRYVPDCSRARDELGLITRIDLPDAVRRTLAWLAS